MSILIVRFGIAPLDRTGDGLFGKQKPDFVQPGSKILSASARELDKYTLMSGTSMATPHLSGVIALLLSLSYRREPSPSSHDDAVVFRVQLPSLSSSKVEEKKHVLPAPMTFEQVYVVLKQAAVMRDMGEPINGGGRYVVPALNIVITLEFHAFDIS